MQPSVVLKFEAVNVGLTRLTDWVLEISIVEKTFEEERVPLRTLLRPFSIRGRVTLDPGYKLQCDILLRHLSTDCNCIGKVSVVSFRSLLTTR